MRPERAQAAQTLGTSELIRATLKYMAAAVAGLEAGGKPADAWQSAHLGLAIGYGSSGRWLKAIAEVDLTLVTPTNRSRYQRRGSDAPPVSLGWLREALDSLLKRHLDTND